MDWTVVIILGVIALVPTIYGMYLSRTPAFPDLMEPPEGYRGILPPKVEDMRVVDPPQSVSGIIPYGQAVGDYPDPEAAYDDIPKAIYPEERESKS